MAEQVTDPLRIDTSNESPSPPISAAFLVNFDHRKGYVLGWHRSLGDVQVEGVVEYKSLPSGLHNVEEDLVYFIHDEYAGISAFINQPDGQSDRAAQMLAVGVLVPLEHGRMGRSWRHAESLKELARAQVDNLTDTMALEEYWEKHKLEPVENPPRTPEDAIANGPAEQLNGYSKSRSMSAGTNFLSSHHSLSPHHPASTLIDSVKLFGPLIFPLFRAALLRKRILIVTETPVESVCNLVYNLSILSSISKALLSFLPEADDSRARLRPLFTVGVMDIAQLEQEKEGGIGRSFIACTTDDVLALKPDLFDILVLMPKADSQQGATKSFPRIFVSSPELTRAFPKVGIRATQRDSHRFTHLQQGLRRLDAGEVAAVDSDTSSVLSQISSYSLNKEVIEPSSWSRMAYTSFVWWASAGDSRTGFAEIEEHENEQDEALLYGEDGGGQTQEVAVVAYFHRMTTIIFETIAMTIARADGEGEEQYHDDDDLDENGSPIGESSQEEDQALLNATEEEAKVEISHENMAEMGLDSWSASDKKFVEELVELWWKRKAVLRPIPIECCGLRIL